MYIQMMITILFRSIFVNDGENKLIRQLIEKKVTGKNKIRRQRRVDSSILQLKYDNNKQNLAV